MRRGMRQQVKRKVLVVDDEREIFSLVSRHLSREGCTTMWAGTGSEALDTIGSKKPDVILLDLMLPDCDGVELLGELTAEHPGIPVIVVTGYASQDRVRSCMEIGACDFLTKPFNRRELCAAVREVLESGQAVGHFTEGGHVH